MCVLNINDFVTTQINFFLAWKFTKYDCIYFCDGIIGWAQYSPATQQCRMSIAMSEVVENEIDERFYILLEVLFLDLHFEFTDM